MFRLHRHKSSSSSAERIDFTFSNIQLLQVPNGWNKLSVSLVSSSTRKTVSKSGKISVRNGHCRWRETLSESIWISGNNTSTEPEECQLTIVVAMGSARSSILGEATIDLARYMNSNASFPVSIPLKNCSHGTIIQVDIQCLTPRRQLVDEEWRDTDSCKEFSASFDHMENNSDFCDCTFTRSVGSFSSNHLDSTSQTGELGSRETSFSASISRHSFDSMEGSFGRDCFSPQSSISGNMNNVIGRQDSTASQNSTYYRSREDFGRIQRPIGTSPLWNTNSSKKFPEAEEGTTEELRVEAGMWERNARKLMLDLESLRKEFSNQSKHLENLDAELSSSLAECDGLKQHIGNLKITLDESMAKEMACELLRFQDREKMDNSLNELRDEIKYQKVSNYDLALQLKKTQESNLELVSVLQEMEETIEKQKIEIENLCKNMENMESQKNMENTILYLEKTLEDKNQEIETERIIKTRVLLDCEAEWRQKLAAKEEEIINLEAKLTENSVAIQFDGGALNLIKDIEDLNAKVKELEMDCNELTDENLQLLVKLKESKTNPSHFGFSPKGCLGNDSPNATELEVRNLHSSRSKFDEEIKKKKTFIQGISGDDLDIQSIDLEDQSTRIKCYKGDTSESRDQPAESSQKFENSEPQIAFNKYEAYPLLHEQLQVFLTHVKEQFPLHSPVKTEAKCNTVRCSSFKNLNEELGSKVEDLTEEMLAKTCEALKLNTDHLLMEEIESLRHRERDLETQLSDLQRIKSTMEERIDIMQREGSMTSKDLDNLRSDVMMLNNNSESHISANKILERNSIELKNSKHDLELQLSELEAENVHLLERISGLEAQLRYLTDARESNRLELQHSLSQCTNLREEMRRLENEMEKQKADMKQKIQDMQNQWLEAQDECEYLKKANPKLQATAENLIEECSSLQRLNGNLRQRNLELHKYCTISEAKLRESRSNFSDCSNKINSLEVQLSSMVEEFSSKERVLNSQLNSLHHENSEHKEKLLLGESLLNQMYLEKTGEIENLQREVEHLTYQISATPDEKEVAASEAVLKMRALYADKGKLENTFLENERKLELSEKNLHTVQMQCDAKVLSLIAELSSSKQNQELLVAKNEKLLEWWENVKTNEKKLKDDAATLDSKLASSIYEKLQLADENSNLKIQLEKIPIFRDEILFLKNSVEEMKFENERLRTSLLMVSGDYEELKAERNRFSHDISRMKKVASELEDCRRCKVKLEEKVLRLTGDLTAREASCTHEAELRNELGRVKRSNSQFQLRIKQLKEEKEELQMTFSEVNKKICKGACGSQEIAISTISRMQLLEMELAEALEEIDIYKSQLKRLLFSEGEIIDLDAPLRKGSNVAVVEEREENKAASLESELREIRERYLEMSLKYAEVEDQREQLVMKLKAVAANSGRGSLWW